MTERVEVQFRDHVYAIDPARVDIEDFLACWKRKGGIVRVDGNPADAIRCIYPWSASEPQLVARNRGFWESVAEGYLLTLLGAVVGIVGGWILRGLY